MKAISIPKTRQIDKAIIFPLLDGEISEIYVGAVTVEAPTPSPPKNLKKEN